MTLRCHIRRSYSLRETQPASYCKICLTTPYLSHTVVCHQQRNEIMKHLVFFVKAFLQQLENFFPHSLPKNPFKPLQLLCSLARYYESVCCKKQDLISLFTPRRFGLLIIFGRLSNHPPKPNAASRATSTYPPPVCLNKPTTL